MASESTIPTMQSDLQNTCTIAYRGRTEVRLPGEFPGIVVLRVGSVVAMRRGRPLHDRVGRAGRRVVHAAARAHAHPPPRSSCAGCPANIRTLTLLFYLTALD